MKPTYKQVTKTRYIEQISQLAEEIFVQHYTKLTPKVARAMAEKYQSDILTDDEIHSGTVNYLWAKDLKAEGFCKKCRFRKSETVPMEVLPGVTLDITTWEKLWR